MEFENLQGKTLVALGDSLFYGNRLGKDATWANKLARYGMTVYNHGINGNPLAVQSKEPRQEGAMCERYVKMEEPADYVIVLGGANDKRLDVPLGEDGSTDVTTFKGALRTLILGLTQKYPRARLLFFTNYNRWPGQNALGLSDIHYVDAMLEVCASLSVPCFDNYRACGLSFQNPAQLPWIDEGLVLGVGENHHFSDEAYEWLLPKYARLLAGL